VPSFTFASTANAFVLRGATPDDVERIVDSIARELQARDGAAG
jgi:dTDP-4-amino-4,6-dideoxygalactose transaminase